MTCTVVLTPQNGRFHAQVAEFPDCKAEAEDRDQTLALLEKRIQEFVNRSEILHLEISAPAQPLSGKTKTPKPPNVVKFEAPNYLNSKEPPGKTIWDYYGIFKDDPTWWPMIDEIERRRDRQRIPTSKRMKK
jgi:hypothetical protein